MLRTTGGAVPPKATHEKRNKQTKVKLEEARKGEEHPSTPLTAQHTCTHCTHRCMHTHAHTIRFIIFGTVSYVLVSRGRHATLHHTQIMILITHPISFWGGGIPACPHNPQTAQTPQPRTSKEKRNRPRPCSRPKPKTGPPRNHPQNHTTSLHTSHRIIAHLRFLRCIDPCPRPLYSPFALPPRVPLVSTQYYLAPSYTCLRVTLVSESHLASDAFPPSSQRPHVPPTDLPPRTGPKLASQQSKQLVGDARSGSAARRGRTRVRTRERGRMCTRKGRGRGKSKRSLAQKSVDHAPPPPSPRPPRPRGMRWAPDPPVVQG